MNKPQTLYRGIHLDANMFYYFDLETDEIKVHYEPVIDSKGRKTVTDGNEYGVYMTDNKQMAFDVYGFPHRTSIEIEPGLTLAPGTRVELPLVGIVYEIDTTNLDIRQPWMTEQLHGVANNGFAGNEWVADSIPKSNYKINK